MNLNDILSPLARGIGAGTLGAPMDLAALLVNSLLAGGGYAGHKLGLLSAEQLPEIRDKPVGGSEWWGEKMQNAGMIGPARNAPLEMAGGLLSTVAAAKAPQVAAGLLKMGENAAAPRQAGLLNPQRGAVVYHGSPHKFDKFDSSKIGTGEGAQAYGHGLYLAESPAVAQTYKDLNPTALVAPRRAFRGAELTPGTPEYHAATLLDGMGLQQARKQVAEWIATARPEMAREVAGWQKTLETLNAATSKADFRTLKNAGHLYKVDLPDSAIARMLDWDKPLSQQPHILKALETHPTMGKDSLGWKGAPPGQWEKAMSSPSRTGEWLYRELAESNTKQADAARAIAPGIRYLDQASRGSGQGTSNFVVFPGEEGLLRILERNGLAP